MLAKQKKEEKRKINLTLPVSWEEYLILQSVCKFRSEPKTSFIKSSTLPKAKRIYWTQIYPLKKIVKKEVKKEDNFQASVGV